MLNALLVPICLCSLFFLNGCIRRYPQDISIVSMHVVAYREQAELPGPREGVDIGLNDPYSEFLYALSRKGNNVVIAPSDMDVYFQRQKNNESFKRVKSTRLLLKVEFTSMVNLQEFARDTHYTILNSSFFCNRPDAPAMVSGPKVFWKGLRIGEMLEYTMWKGRASEVLEFSMEQRDNIPFTYYTFINVTSPVPDLNSLENFDLRSHPEDICFQLRGGAGWRGFQSNVVVISKSEIVKALKEIPSELNKPTPQSGAAPGSSRDSICNTGKHRPMRCEYSP